MVVHTNSFILLITASFARVSGARWWGCRGDVWVGGSVDGGSSVSVGRHRDLQRS